MKKLVGALAVVLVTTVSTLGDQPARDPRRAECTQEKFRAVEDRLALTSEQAEQVRAVLGAVPELMRAVREDYGAANPSRSSRRRMARELRAIRSYAEERLKRVLSRAQMNELKAIRKAWDEELESGTVLASK